MRLEVGPADTCVQLWAVEVVCDCIFAGEAALDTGSLKGISGETLNGVWRIL